MTRAQQQRLAEWMRNSHVSALAPEDWAVSGECARLLATTLLRYATALEGDLTHAEVRSDLRMLRAVVDMALDAGREQAARVKQQAASNALLHKQQRQGSHRSAQRRREASA